MLLIKRLRANQSSHVARPGRLSSPVLAQWSSGICRPVVFLHRTVPMAWDTETLCRHGRDSFASTDVHEFADTGASYVSLKSACYWHCSISCVSIRTFPMSFFPRVCIHRKQGLSNRTKIVVVQIRDCSGSSFAFAQKIGSA